MSGVKGQKDPPGSDMPFAPALVRPSVAERAVREPRVQQCDCDHRGRVSVGGEIAE